LFLDRRNVYSACHVILVASVLVARATLVACLFCGLRCRSDRTTVVLGLLLAGHFAIVRAKAHRDIKQYLPRVASRLALSKFSSVARALGLGMLIEFAPRMLRWTDLRMGSQKMV
jgi:hypothetical protein